MKKYTTPELKTVLFTSEDIMETSGVGTYSASNQDYLTDNGLMLKSTVGGSGSAVAGSYFFE